MSGRHTCARCPLPYGRGTGRIKAEATTLSWFVQKRVRRPRRVSRLTIGCKAPHPLTLVSLGGKVSSENRQLLAQASRHALELFRTRIAAGLVAIPQIQESILAQLEWLTDFAEQRNDDRARLAKLMFGVYVAREELNPDDRELNDALSKAFYAAETYSRGLKIDPHVVSPTPPNTSFKRTREG